MQYEKNADKEGFLTTLKKHLMYTSEKYDESSNFFLKWAPSLVSCTGLLISWEMDVVIGMIFGACGFMYGLYSKNNTNKLISTVAGGITVALSLLFLL